MNAIASLTLNEIGPLALRVFGDHLLVFCRILGLLVLIPAINAAALGWQFRAILLVTLAAIITPNVSTGVQSILNPGTIQQVSREEPANLESDFAAGRNTSERDQATFATSNGTVASWIYKGLTELCLGLVLGAGANLVMQSFRMAGSLIEYQTGLSLGQTNSPEIEGGETGSGELLFGLGAVLFLIAGGHLLFISTLLGTFREFPVGFGSVSNELPELVASLVEQSLKVALQLAAPVLATQILASYCLAQAGNLAPQFNTTGISNPVRVVAAGIVLCFTLSGLSDRMLDLMPEFLELFHAPLAFAACFS